MEGSILEWHIGFLKNVKGGIFILSKGEVEKNDIKLLEFTAKINIACSKGSLKNAINEIEDEDLNKQNQITENYEKAQLVEEIVKLSKKVIILNPEDRYKWDVVDSCVSLYEDAGAHVYEVNTLNQLAQFVETL